MLQKIIANSILTIKCHNIIRGQPRDKNVSKALKNPCLKKSRSLCVFKAFKTLSFRERIQFKQGKN